MFVRTKAGMTSAAESITESLRRTRQLMVQVVKVLSFLFLILICMMDYDVIFSLICVNRRLNEVGVLS